MTPYQKRQRLIYYCKPGSSVFEPIDMPRSVLKKRLTRRARIRARDRKRERGRHDRFYPFAFKDPIIAAARYL